MSDESALLTAILAHPDEDTPRLMFADWLDEHGQTERAEFIRIQCGIHLDDAGKARAFELEEWHRAKWLVGLPGGTRWNWEFHRGFPENLCVNFNELQTEFEAIHQADWPRRLSLLEVPQRITGDALDRVWNPRWVELELQASTWAWGYSLEEASIPTVVAIATCPQVAQLRRLRFSRFMLTEASVQELARSGYLDNLQQLRLDGSPHYPALTALRERFGDRLVIG